MNLSEHFTLAEMTVSETAARHGIDNDPPPDVLEALRRTAQGLEGIRKLLDAPVIVTSGYRAPELNKLVGGQPLSQHVRGEAADFISPRFGTPAEIVKLLVQSRLAYDQVILEFGRWVHVSFSPRPRRTALIIDSKGTRAYA